MADDSALACAAEQADKARLLELLQTHLTITLKVEAVFGDGEYLTVMVDFDGEPIATDFVHIST